MVRCLVARRVTDSSFITITAFPANHGPRCKGKHFCPNAKLAACLQHQLDTLSSNKGDMSIDTFVGRTVSGDYREYRF